MNANNGIIDALGIVQDEPDPFANLNVFTLPILANSYVEINATNIVNHGLLESDNQGLIRLEGQNVDLSRGGIKIKPIIDFYDNLFSLVFCFFGGTTDRNLGGSFYIPDIGISDAYWGGKTNDWFADSIYFLANVGFVALTPPHDIIGLRPPYFRVIDNQFF
ncbi:MAG: hypothetical protein DME19_15380, partial [Verrucomicrobia bacterium]